MTEEQQIAYARNGDIRAFKGIYQTHSAWVFRVCKRLLVRQAIAEEATQEVFVKIWQQLHQFSGQAKFSTWVYRIAVNTAVDHIRKQRVQEVALEETAEWSEPVGAELGADDALLQLISRLPERARIVFVLYAIEGRTHQEIAELLGITEGGSKAHYARARSQLQTWWNGDEIE